MRPAVLRTDRRRRRHARLSPHQRVLAAKIFSLAGVQPARVVGALSAVEAPAPCRLGNVSAAGLRPIMAVAIPTTGADAAMAADLGTEVVKVVTWWLSESFRSSATYNEKRSKRR